MQKIKNSSKDPVQKSGKQFVKFKVVQINRDKQGQVLRTQILRKLI
jgi:hypothetical protein